MYRIMHGVAAGEHDYEPGSDGGADRTGGEKEENDVTEDCEQPLDQRPSAVQTCPAAWRTNPFVELLKRNRLLLFDAGSERWVSRGGSVIC